MLSVATASLFSCSAPKYGCDYKGKRVPKFTASVQAELIRVHSNKPGKAVLVMKAKGVDTLYCYYGYLAGLSKKKFFAGDKYTIRYDSTDTAKFRKSIITRNS